MKKLLVLLFVLLGSVMVSATDWDDIYSTKSFKIKESMISFTKEYNVYIGDEKVAVVKGKFFNGFGDTFTLTDMKGNIILTESQVKRSFRFSLDRLAIVKDKYNNTHGYIGERIANTLFNPWVNFFFYDANEKELGYNKIKLSLTKKANYLDMQDNIEYKVEKEFFALVDTYNITVFKNDDIPIEYAIFMVCIHDAIRDAEDDDD